MSEAHTENPNQVSQEGAAEQSAPSQPAPQSNTAAGDEFPLRLVKVEDQTTHWNVAKGIWEQVVHAETGEPNASYALVATIDGADIELASWNAGRIDTRVRSLQQANQSSGA